MRPPYRLTFFAATAAFALIGTACSKPDSAKDALSRDLEQAGSSSSSSSNGLQLAPSAGKTSVVSAVERAPAGPPAPTASRVAPKPKIAPHAPPEPVTPPAAAPAPVQQAVAPAPAPETAQAEPPLIPNPNAMRRPSAVSQQQKEPPGGWKSTSEVIRDAPFPVTP